MSWHDDAMTDGQREYIRVIESYIPQTGMKKFTGKTKGEACAYINKYKQIDKELRELDELRGAYVESLND